MTRPLPPYPPATDTWQFAPPPVARRWRWIAALAAASALLAGAVGTVLLVRHGDDDFVASFEDERVTRAVERACDRMADVVAGTPAGSDPARRADAVRAQNAAVLAMVEQLRALPVRVRAADRPVDLWLADWELLVGAREAYAVELERNGAAEFRVPQVHGDPVTDRMDRVADPYCEVPQELTEPDAGVRSAI